MAIQNETMHSSPMTMMMAVTLTVCGAPHSSSFPPTTAPLQTLHMDVWGPARVSGQDRECYFLLVVDDYTRYTTVFPLRSKGEVPDVLIPWIRAVCLQLRERGEGILQSFMLPASPQKNGVAARHIGLVMEVARTSMIHAAAPHFLWPFAVRYAAHRLKLWPRVSLPETSPTPRWKGKVGDVSVFRVWGSRAFVRDTSADKLSSRAIPCDVTFDESVPFHRLFPYRTAPPPPPPLFLAPGPFPVDPLPPQGPPPSGVSHVDPLHLAEPVEVNVDSGAAGGGATRGSASGGAEPVGAEPGGAEPEGAEPGGAETGGAETGGAESEGAEFGGAEPRGTASGGGAGGPAAGGTGAGGVGATSPGGAGVTSRAEGTGGAGATGPRGARTSGTRVAGAGGSGAGDPGARGARAGGAGAGGTGAGGTIAGDPGAGGAGIGGAGAGGAGAGGTGAGGAGAGGAGSGGVGARGFGAGDPRAGDPGARGAGDGGAGAGSFGAGGTMQRRPFFVPPPSSSLPPRGSPSPPASSLADGLDAESDLVRAASPTVTRLLATIVTDPSFESAAASALVIELVDFAAACRLDYAASLVAESESDCPPSVGGDPDAPAILTLRSYAEAKTGLYSSQWRTAMDGEMASWKSTGTYVDAVPPPGANIVNGMWIFRVKRPPGSPLVFKARYVAQGFRQPQGVDFFQTFSPTLKMTTLRVLLHVTFERDYKLHSLDFSTAFLQVYGLRLAPREWHDTPRMTLVALGFAPSTADPSLFLRTDTSLPPFYICVYINDLVFATADTEALACVKSELQKRHTCTDLDELRSYLGLQITRDRARRTITLTESHMVH
ncbi:unnamed protein product [Closterium sp. NIES-54]